MRSVDILHYDVYIAKHKKTPRVELEFAPQFSSDLMIPSVTDYTYVVPPPTIQLLMTAKKKWRKKMLHLTVQSAGTEGHQSNKLYIYWMRNYILTLRRMKGSETPTATAK